MTPRLTAERGATIPIVALVITVVVLGTSFSVDLGGLTNTTRTLQKVADLAALDAAWVLDGSDTETLEAAIEEAATESALRNEFGNQDDEVLEITPGVWDRAAGHFTPTGPSDTPNAVRIAASMDHDYLFQPGRKQPTRSAVAARIDDGDTTTTTAPGSSTTSTTGPTTTTTTVQPSEVAGFSAGSRLASVDSSQATLLNDIFGDAFGASVSMTVLDYNNVAGTTVTVEELGAAMGMSSGTPNEVLDTTITVDQLLSATATVLDNQGQAAAAGAVASLASDVTSTSMELSAVIAMGPGGEDAAFTAPIDVLGLITGTAFVADGDSFLSLPSLTASVPGVTGLTAGLRVLEGPRYAFYPAFTELHTSQLELDIVSTVDVDLSHVAPSLRATGTIPLDVELVSLDVSMTDIGCPDDDTDLLADPDAAEAATSADLIVTEEVLGSPTNVARAELGGAASTDSAAQPLLDMSPVETRSFGSDTAGLATMDIDVVDASLTGPLSVSLTVVTDGLADYLSSMLAEVDTEIVAPVADMLGMRFTGGDVTLHSVDCDAPVSQPSPPTANVGGIPEIVA